MKKIILCAALLCFLSTVVFTEAYYAGKEEMIKEAEAIAIVEIVKIKEIKHKGTHWTYSQKAVGIVEKSLKGDIQGNIVIYGMEDFICAQSRFEKGRFLLFLRKDNDFWISSNWNIGIRPIKNGKVDWLKDDTCRFEMEQKQLEKVVSEIQHILEKEEQLQLTIKSDKEVYEIDEEVILEATFSNKLDKKLIIFWDNEQKPIILTEEAGVYIVAIYLEEYDETIRIMPQQSFNRTVPIILSSDFKPIEGQLGIVFLYSNLGMGIDFKHGPDEELWQGTITSNYIAIEIVEKFISKEEVLKIAEEICEESGWEWKDVGISEYEDRWQIVTNSPTLGGNAVIYVDKKTGKVLKKFWNPM